MKRKILSLALALMMIISVVAAMPVSADDVQPIIIAGTTATGLVSGYHTAGSVPATTDDDAAWATESAARLLYGSSGANKHLQATYTVPVTTAGYYDVDFAYARKTDTPVYLEYGVQNIPVMATASTARTHAKNIRFGKIYLNEGDNTVIVGVNTSANINDHFALFGLRFSYSTVQSADNTPIYINGNKGTGVASNFKATSVGAKTADEDATWAFGGASLAVFGSSAASNQYAIKYTFTVPAAGNYDISVGYARVATAAAYLKFGSEQQDVTLPATDATTDVKNYSFDAIYLPAGEQTITFGVNTKDKTGHFHLYALKAEWSAIQPAAQYTITAAAETGGTATANGASSALAEEGETVTLNATANKGYIFAGWHDGTGIVSTDAEYVVTVAGDKTYTATFSVDPAIYVHETNDTVTKLSTSSWSIAQTATTNTTTWAETVGIRQVGANWNGFQYTVPVTAAGWYDVYLAYGTSQTNAKAQVIFGDSVDLQSAVAATGGNGTIGEAMLGKVYLASGDNTIKLWLYSGTNASSWAFAHYGLKFAPTDVKPTSVNINGGLPTDYTAYQVDPRMSYANSGLPSWVTYGSSRIDGNSQGATYTAMVPESGYYTVKIAVGATKNSNPRISFSVNGVPEFESVYLNAAISGSNGNLQDVGVTTLTRVYLTAGSATFTVEGVQDMHACRVQNILLVAEDLPEADTLRIKDDDDNDLSYVSAGERVIAEVALDASVEGANIFLVQYAGTGAEKRMVATTFTGAAAALAYTVDGISFYNVKAIVADGADEIKAFVWTTDAEFSPLCGTESVSVN